MFDIFNIEPHTISRSLVGKHFLIYGERKIGKTSTSAKFKNPILVAFEAGYSGINGIKPVPVSDWNFFKRQVVAPLVKQAEMVKKGQLAETTYSTIIIDTADLCFDACEKYILAAEGIQSLDESESKRAYRKLEKEFEDTLLQLMKCCDATGRQLYSVIFISHEEVKQEKDAITKQKETKIGCTMNKRAFKVISRAVDLTIYMRTVPNPETGVPERWAFLRTNGLFECGNRYTYLPSQVPLNYQAIEEAILTAIDKQAEEDGIVATEGTKSLIADEITYDFEALMTEARELYGRFEAGEQVPQFLAIVEKVLGVGARLSEMKPTQAMALASIVDDLKDKATELGLA